MALFLLFNLLCVAVSALFTADGSPCSDTCSAVNGTSTASLVCTDTSFFSTTKGQLFRSCLECQSKSLYINGTESDQYFYLFHMKYTQQFCIADNANARIAPVQACATECAPLTTPLDVAWLQRKPWHPQYAYCSDNSSVYPTYAPNCAECLRSRTGSVILGNFVDTMADACADAPLASNSALIQTDRGLFATSTIATSSSATATTTSTSTASPSQTAIPATGGGGLSTGAAAGIGVGSVIAVLILAAGIYFLWRKKSRTSKAAPIQASSQKPSQPIHQSYQQLDQKPTQTEIQGYELYEAQGRPIEAHDKKTYLAELAGN